MIDYHSKVTFNIDDIKLSYKQKFFLKGLFLLKIFKAKKIITMNRRNPEAQYMSVLDGKIVQVGDLNTIKPEGKYELDKSFENYVLMPGLVEGHVVFLSVFDLKPHLVFFCLTLCLQNKLGLIPILLMVRSGPILSLIHI